MLFPPFGLCMGRKWMALLQFQGHGGREAVGKEIHCVAGGQSRKGRNECMARQVVALLCRLSQVFVRSPPALRPCIVTWWPTAGVSQNSIVVLIGEIVI